MDFWKFLDPIWGFTLKTVRGIHDPRISWLPIGTKNHEMRRPPVLLILWQYFSNHWYIEDLWHHFYMIFIRWFLEWPYFLGFCIAKKEAIWWKGWVVHFLFANGRERSNYCPNSILSATQEWMHIHSDSACIWVVHKLRWHGKVLIGRWYWK